MRITKLSLTNFRSFKDTQTIEFAPVTLLFGPNSVGKSTVLMALFYLQQILGKGQCNPQRLEALGNKFVGGFENLVNGRDMSKPIVICVEYEMNETLGSGYFDLVDALDFDCELALDTDIVANGKRAIEFEIRWSELESTAYVSNCRYWINDEFLGQLEVNDSLKGARISLLNYLHPVLTPLNHDDWLVEQFENSGWVHGSLYEKALFETRGIETPSHRDISKGADWPPEEANEWPDESDDAYVSVLHEIINQEWMSDDSLVNYRTDVCNATMVHAPLSFKAIAGSLPLIGKKIATSLELDNSEYNSIVHEILSECFVTPLDDLLVLLNSSLCIGPLRNIPDATFQPDPYPEMKDWYKGRACWDVLNMTEYSSLMKIDKWISDEDKLNLGYKLVKKQKRQKDYCMDIRQYDENETMPWESNDQIMVSSSISLWDKIADIEVSASDIGVGVSQLMPLVVASMTAERGVIACEQPELHVHPRVQVAIGDLLTQANDKANFLIETHSEHLILRILRRIRETTDNELPEGIKPVKPKGVSIVYIEPSSDGVVVKNIDINEDGEFETRWPQGFFAERRGELY